MDQTASSYQGVLRQYRKRGEDANLDCDYGLYPSRHRKETPQD